MIRHHSVITVVRSKQQSDAKNLPFWEAMAPGLPLVLLCVCYYVWSVVSPNNVLVAQPRVFMFSLGIVSSNIAVSVSM